MTPKKTLGLIVIIIILAVAFSSFYTVREGQQALLLRFGKMVKNTKTNKPLVVQPGLHFKWPFVNQVRIFDTRLQTLAIDSSRIITEKQKIVLVDYYVKWRIDNLPLYYTRTGGLRSRTELLLQQKTNNGLRAEFGRRTIQEVVSDERLSVMSALKKVADQSAKALGVKVVDVRIKGIDLPPKVSDSVFQRMSTKREQVAAQHRADGKAAAEVIKANADAKVTVISATANETAAKLKARGTAKAAQIYARAYGQDSKFYAFYQSLLAYEKAFDKRSDVIVMNPNNQFFKYFNESQSALSGK